MEIPEKFKKEPGELKVFLANGSVRIIFKDGTIWEVEDPKEESVEVEVLPDKALEILKYPLTSRLFYMLILRPYHKFGIASEYYGRTKNLARGHIDKALKALEERGLLRREEWRPEFKEKYDIPSKSRYVLFGNIIPLLKKALSDGNKMKPEHFFLVNIFEAFPSRHFFFEWEVKGIREKNVDVLKLLKMKLLTLLLFILQTRLKFPEENASLKNVFDGFSEVARKLGFLFQYIDSKPVIDYLFKLLLHEVPQTVMGELKSITTSYYGGDEEVLKLFLMSFFFSLEDLEGLVERAMMM